jgi:hypothetical protein
LGKTGARADTSWSRWYYLLDERSRIIVVFHAMSVRHVLIYLLFNLIYVFSRKELRRKDLIQGSQRRSKLFNGAFVSLLTQELHSLLVGTNGTDCFGRHRCLLVLYFWTHGVYLWIPTAGMVENGSFQCGCFFMTMDDDVCEDERTQNTQQANFSIKKTRV